MNNLKILITISALFFNTILLFSQSAPDSMKSEIQLRTYVEQDSVPLNREVVYHVELRWQGELNRYKINEVLEPSLSNLSTRGSGSSNSFIENPDGSDLSVKRITFYFTPAEMGMAYIDGVTIRYEDTILEHQESLLAGRLGIKIVEPLEEKNVNGQLSLLLYIVLFLIASALSFYFFKKYTQRKKEEQSRQLQDLKETIEQKYVRLLKETVHFNTDNIKDSLTDLTHLLTGYFSERYHFPAANISAENLLKILNEKDLAEESFERIKDFYTRADLVKFAGEKMDESEFHRLYDTVELVLENQKLKFSEEEKA